MDCEKDMLDYYFSYSLCLLHYTTIRRYMENKDIYTAYLTLEIDKDLSFNMYDAEAGNPVIRGKMIKKDDTLTLQCDHLDDFDPPASWESMKTTETIQYYFKNNKLYLKYNNSTLVFYKK